MRWRGGGHGWHGGRGPRRGQIARLVEPCLLALLREGPRHGYDLIASLDRFGFTPEMVDSGMVYRTLRSMEAEGWVSSEWEMGASGPPRRVYSLTPAGEEALAAWRGELNRTHEVLHRLLGSGDER
ncbi:MAG: helix-turn-helix transcriptional regulator [Dehalococcoidales bacterium]|nr:helix-turn-helix transcriptional regulator [Dehalococcoidales bacterium]